MDGWIKLHRKFLRWEWYGKSEMVHLFLHLLLSANHDDSRWRGIDVKRGQVVTGLSALNRATGLTIQKLRTCLSQLQKTGEINRQSNNQYSIITIMNYESYQVVEASNNKRTNKQLTGYQQATNKQLTTNKNIRNKEIKENKEINIPAWDEFKKYALENKPTVDVAALKLKYQSWVENKWHDGNNKPIKIWRSKLLNTLPYLPEKFANLTTDRMKTEGIDPEEYAKVSPTAITRKEYLKQKK